MTRVADTDKCPRVLEDADAAAARLRTVGEEGLALRGFKMRVRCVEERRPEVTWGREVSSEETRRAQIEDGRPVGAGRP
jgi:hypothetical protein